MANDEPLSRVLKGQLLSLQDSANNCYAMCACISMLNLASIPGRVFAFITVRRTTGPGTSCLRMRQIFIVFVVGKDI